MKVSRFNVLVQKSVTPRAFLAISIMICLPEAQAVEKVWGNTGTTWNSPSAWVGGLAPASSTATDTVLFTNTAATNNSVGFTSARSINTVTFSSTANAYTFSDDGFALTIGGGGIAHNSANTQTFNTPLIAGASQSWTTVTGATLTVGALDLAPTTTNRTVTIAGSGAANIGTIQNSVGSAGALLITSSGTTNLTGDNTYDGLTTMNNAAGTLTLSGNNSGASGGVTVTAGTLNVNSTNALGTGTLTLAASSVLNNTSGAAIVNAGNNAVTWGTNSTAVVIGTGAGTSANNLDLGTGTMTASTTRAMTILGTGTGLTAGTLEMTSASASAITLTFDGAGNSASFRGFKLASNSPNAVLTKLSGTADLSFTGAIVNGSAYDNGVNIDRTGLTVFSGTNTYTGETKITNGILQVTNTLALPSASSLSSGTSNTNTGSLNLAAASADYTMNQLIVGGAMKFTGPVSGSSTITFTGGGTLTGTGSGRIINVGTDTHVVINGASFDFIGSTGPDLRSTSFVIDGAMTINAVVQDNASGTSAGFVGGFTKTGAGVLTLTGNNTYGGTTNVNGGKLLVNGVNSGAAAVNVGSGGTLGGTGQIAGTVNVTGVLSPGNSIESLGTGALNFVVGSTYAYELDSAALNGDLTFSTATLNIAEGTTLTLTQLASGTLAPGSKLTLISYFDNGGPSGWNDGLFNYGGLLADDSTFVLGSNTWLFDYNDTSGGSNFTDDQNGANRFVTMTVVAIPEPASALLGGFGLLLVLRRRQR